MDKISKFSKAYPSIRKEKIEETSYKKDEKWNNNTKTNIVGTNKTFLRGLVCNGRYARILKRERKNWWSKLNIPKTRK